MPILTRPAKRQRRSKVISDEDEEPAQPSGTYALRAKSTNITNGSKATQSVSKLKPVPKRGQATLKGRSSTASPKSSPETPRKKAVENVKSKSINSFFSRSRTPDRFQSNATKAEEIIDDDSADETLQEALRRSKQDITDKDNGSLSSQQTNKSTTARFRRPPPPARKPSAAEKHEDLPPKDVRPWAEQYAPVNLEEIAVHKKKVQDVQNWLDGALTGKSGQRILVLKGPAGTGKSTTIQLIAKALNLELSSWQNPDTSESGSLSNSQQFFDFILLGGEYGALSVSNAHFEASKAHSRILMIEEFPAAISHNSIVLASFRAALSNAATASANDAVFAGASSGLQPIVLIVSETLTSSSTSLSDSFTTQRLLGAELINHPAVFVIEFNPVAPTFLNKALDLVIRKEARESGRRRIPGSAILQHLAEIGDVRNAINSLQLLCTRRDEVSDWTGTVATNAKRSTKSAQPLSQMELDSLELLSSRESTLDMFHAAGKVCYNKREDPRIGNSAAGPVPEPPDHLQHLHRPKVSQVNIDELLNETGTDIQTFVATVQQNYVLSCNHADFVDYFDGCASVLSDAELLDPDSRMSIRTKARAHATQNQFQLGTTDALRQDEISFQVATRGVLFHLPFPVSRAAPPGAGRGAAFKMYYPVSMRLWRHVEETNGLIDLVMNQMGGQTTIPRSGADAEDSVATWKARASAFQSGLGSRALDDNDDDVMERIEFSKETLLLETLPYLTLIGTARGDNVNLSRKISQLRGFNAVVEDESDEDSKDEETLAPTQSIGTNQMAHRPMSRLGASNQVQQADSLLVEEDDIEDDIEDD